ncbi:MAG TPA: type II toxin-antitoxin system PemK/MazF family toxin [Trueperaceae bacterium]|nr:type II toxin-antitoxin system PemK/MazF family toxin [Trueperaceae bacterium]
MSKDFDRWNIVKKGIDTTPIDEIQLYKEREVWWCSLGLNIGYEQDGKGQSFLRPVLVLRKFNKHIFLGVPSTGNMRKRGDFYCAVYTRRNSFNFILSQIRLFDAYRLVNRMTILPSNKVEKVKKALVENVIYRKQEPQ